MLGDKSSECNVTMPKKRIHKDTPYYDKGHLSYNQDNTGMYILFYKEVF